MIGRKLIDRAGLRDNAAPPGLVRAAKGREEGWLIATGTGVLFGESCLSGALAFGGERQLVQGPGRISPDLASLWTSYLLVMPASGQTQPEAGQRPTQSTQPASQAQRSGGGED